MTRVLPVPAPASTSSGPVRVLTASRWARFRSGAVPGGIVGCRGYCSGSGTRSRRKLALALPTRAIALADGHEAEFDECRDFNRARAWCGWLWVRRRQDQRLRKYQSRAGTDRALLVVGEPG